LRKRRDFLEAGLAMRLVVCGLVCGCGSRSAPDSSQASTTSPSAGAGSASSTISDAAAPGAPSAMPGGHTTSGGAADVDAALPGAGSASHGVPADDAAAAPGGRGEAGAVSEPDASASARADAAATGPDTGVASGPGTDAAADAGSSEIEAARALCVQIINADRATLSPPAAPLTEYIAQDSCADREAQEDEAANRGHASFGLCKEQAQDECPGYAGSLTSVVTKCLAQMWAEGPPPAGQDNHWLNMSNPRFTKVACGYYQTPSGSWWAPQNFWP
jgi:hypothetical protein